jgi:hypothetical protein
VNYLEKFEQLKKALEAGGYNAAPGSLTQGSALQQEDLSAVMNVATYDDSAIKLQKILKVVPAKGTLVQFNRQLDYGIFGGSAALEGGVGQEETSTYVRKVVPMAYYVHIRRTTIQSEMIEAFDGVKAENRVEADAAIKLAGDIEFGLYRGQADYSNNGVFDGNPLAMSEFIPGMQGLDPQIRYSDAELSSQDLMFNEYGSNASVVIPQNGVLQQTTIQSVYATSQMNHGAPEKLYLDPLTHGSYNNIAFGKERIILAGSPQKATGASLNEQWVAGGGISIESSRFVSAKTQPARTRIGAPSTPIAATSAQSAGTTAFNSGEVYLYNYTAVNELGESAASPNNTVTISATGNSVTLTLTAPAGAVVRYFNMYRSSAGGSILKFIGRVKTSGASTTTFTDLDNFLPGSITAFALDWRGIEVAELSPYKSQELARVDLTTPKAFFRFLCLQVKLPRFNILVTGVTA